MRRIFDLNFRCVILFILVSCHTFDAPRAIERTEMCVVTRENLVDNEHHLMCAKTGLVWNSAHSTYSCRVPNVTQLSASTLVIHTSHTIASLARPPPCANRLCLELPSAVL